jgi:hypothetical protein
LIEFFRGWVESGQNRPEFRDDWVESEEKLVGLVENWVRFWANRVEPEENRNKCFAAWTEFFADSIQS